MTRVPIPTWYFALVVVRRGERFLLVRERKHGQRWYLPAGRVEPCETLETGALRETLEESGVPVVLDGVLRVEHTPDPNGHARCRVFFTAHPLDDTPPLAAPNEHALEARWVGLADLAGLDLRHPEVRDVLMYVDAGGPVAPLWLLTAEGASWQTRPAGDAKVAREAGEALANLGGSAPAAAAPRRKPNGGA